MNYTKEDIINFTDTTKGKIETMINLFVNNFVNLTILHIENNYYNKITLTIHSQQVNGMETEIYPHRMEVLNRLKLIFPTMNITYIYKRSDMEYMDITFDWN